ncbi:hypothetical protein B0T10DRAFT_466608 [Thelonectria olida]|uniref:Alcohol dehydrogenase-like C-terminal domain-containing protein n=1 Tax=Thelonectria olida TaxID=1576542 RepID=A0A9P8VTD6_9HYPO|nr:hypothetical protein B0T10DRAFT_466608 [Thelonectria olida]
MHIPNDVSFAQAAVAADALATSYRAVVTEAGAKPSMIVGVIGLGGLGMSGLRFGVFQGAVVISIKFEEAQRLGARGSFKSLCHGTPLAVTPRGKRLGIDRNCSNQRGVPAAYRAATVTSRDSLDEAQEVPFNVIVDFTDTGSSTQGALGAVKEGGKVVVVGLAAKTVTVPTDVLVLRTVALAGSLGSSTDDLAKVLKLLQEGFINRVLWEVSFSDILTSINTLAKGGVKGRLWADPSKEVE